MTSDIRYEPNESLPYPLRDEAQGQGVAIMGVWS